MEGESGWAAWRRVVAVTPFHEHNQGGPEVGADRMQLVTMGDLIAGDVCVYPAKRTFKPARGLELPY